MILWRLCTCVLSCIVYGVASNHLLFLESVMASLLSETEAQNDRVLVWKDLAHMLAEITPFPSEVLFCPQTWLDTSFYFVVSTKAEIECLSSSKLKYTLLVRVAPFLGLTICILVEIFHFLWSHKKRLIFSRCSGWPPSLRTSLGKAEERSSSFLYNYLWKFARLFMVKFNGILDSLTAMFLRDAC